jgi:SAM-dependent methyltransferase
MTTATEPTATAGEPLNLSVEVVCPKCRKQTLARYGEAIRCSACGWESKYENGFPDLIIGERFEDDSDCECLLYEEGSNETLTRDYFLPLFKRIWPDRSTPPKLLSLGCGTGVDVDILGDAGFNCVGIEIGNRTKVWPRRKRSERLLLANGMMLPFADGSFDGVFLGCVFPHVGVVGDSNIPSDHCEADRQRMASEIARVLKPNGRCIVSSPNRLFLFDLFHGRKPGQYTPRLNPPGSRFLLSVGDYISMFKKAGCRSGRPLPAENYWGFVRSRKSLKGLILGMPVRFVFWLTSLPAMRFLRGSFIDPWIVVQIEK